jgi:hypothetical protein
MTSRAKGSVVVKGRVAVEPVAEGGVWVVLPGEKCRPVLFSFNVGESVVVEDLGGGPLVPQMAKTVKLVRVAERAGSQAAVR